MRLDDAIKMAKEALKIQPGYYDANLLLGFVYVNQNNPTAALPYLQEASETRPRSPRPHEFLAQAYAAMGSEEKAQQEQAIAQQLKQRPNQ
jgi:predicted Zn-dependent protease